LPHRAAGRCCCSSLLLDNHHKQHTQLHTHPRIRSTTIFRLTPLRPALQAVAAAAMPRASRTSTRGAAAAATPTKAGSSASPPPAAPRSATRSSVKREVKAEQPSTPSPSKKTPASTPASQAKAAEKKIASLRASLDEGPFPTWARPTPQDCQEVAQLLADAHGYRAIPTGKKAQKKEESFGGCGNV
jgi:hypothetical protein